MKRFLLIQLRQLGDILLTTPCIRELRKAYPDARIDFLTHRMGHLVLDGNPFIDSIYSYHEKDSWLNQLSLLKLIRSNEYDTVIDFMYNPRSALWTYFSGARQRYAFPSRRAWAYSDIVPELGYTDYIVREKFALLKAIGVDTQDESLTLTWTEQNLGPYFESKKELFPVDSQMRVVLSPTHRREVRQWPGKSYIELANALQERGAQVVWIWGPGEKNFVTELQSKTKLPSYLSPNTSFRELAAFLGNVDLFIGNSNGPSHVAVSCGTPSIQLHGPTSGVSWCPNNEEHRFIQSQVMEGITVDQVMSVFEDMSGVLTKTAVARRRKGDRMSWQDDT